MKEPDFEAIALALLDPLSEEELAELEEAIAEEEEDTEAFELMVS